jgi:hypothetical protein
MSGIGMGMPVLLKRSWKYTIGSVLRSRSKSKESCSTLVSASMPVVSAGCGVPTRTSGPQYAFDMPGEGPGSR